ncbi:putative transcriptional regulator [Hasllibacter halocynthiae]|uniref:Putative transcriptional regulator n=1 Tax=Hasllibacter halocynthiae TaxID=595589 RepID=A0A2T0X375_9RHOB|nr:helix-turn-helix domain-containing protein [Hasllibacter halocynthiae]PRY93403.1 putative transcriptional regulator [Hasllibacter halocynthiae]
MRLIVRLRAHREAAGLTQAALADAVGVSRKTVNTIENGVFVPSTELALRLAAALGARVEDLFALPPD